MICRLVMESISDWDNNVNNQNNSKFSDTTMAHKGLNMKSTAGLW